jgi:hypothetical protein
MMAVGGLTLTGLLTGIWAQQPTAQASKIPRDACINTEHCFTTLPDGTRELSTFTAAEQDDIRTCVTEDKCPSGGAFQKISQARWYTATAVQVGDASREKVSEWYYGCDKAGVDYRYTNWFIAGRPRVHLVNVGFLPMLAVGVNWLGPIAPGILLDLEWHPPEPDKRMAFTTVSQHAEWGRKARLHVQPLTDVIRGDLLVWLKTGSGPDQPVLMPGMEATYDDLKSWVNGNEVPSLEVIGEEVPMTQEEGQEICGWAP